MCHPLAFVVARAERTQRSVTLGPALRQSGMFECTAKPRTRCEAEETSIENGHAPGPSDTLATDRSNNNGPPTPLDPEANHHPPRKQEHRTTVRERCEAAVRRRAIAIGNRSRGWTLRGL